MVKKVLIITSNEGIEHDELVQPLDFLQSHGFVVIHAAEKNEDVHTMEADSKPSAQYTPDTTMHEVSVEDYDLLVIPGGTVNADKLRTNEDAQRIIQYFADNQKPIAAICHGPWALIDAGRVKDKNLTSYKSIKLDLENAGAKWVDEEVHRCNTNGWVLITSRNPDDLPAFNTAIVEELEADMDIIP
ncbi:protease [Acinetobacter sp. HA]|uniref:type 1 glutamine amidotransferase domain-containing protein n=1 Tax=Acinetobacter TaxID=469 RepID=UPI000263E55C|nr:MULTISPECIES: type 1 glutamine amidotransferase domain-containing protein [Acinetobacter]EIM38147.1 protease [Acinetobacter sp. HA]EIM38321.1 protease [Acinetobacter sp. HA]MBB4835216.1 protease I [Acinetobacter schindleri]WBX38141.1 type 1 glutamine amidotransferase [Acinetobacter schindleri]